jgi:hypothetical protein
MVGLGMSDKCPFALDGRVLIHGMPPITTNGRDAFRVWEVAGVDSGNHRVRIVPTDDVRFENGNTAYREITMGEKENACFHVEQLMEHDYGWQTASYCLTAVE